MRLVIHVTHFINWEPVPADVEVTADDIKSGRVKPDTHGRGHEMAVTRSAKMVTGQETSAAEIGIAESTIIARIIHDHMPQNGGLMLTRKQAVANLLAQNIMPRCAHPKHFASITVDVDDGPDEALFRKTIEPYTVAKHASGVMLIDPDDVETMLVRYMAEADAVEHEDHLHAHFGVTRKVSK